MFFICAQTVHVYLWKEGPGSREHLSYHWVTTHYRNLGFRWDLWSPSSHAQRSVFAKSQVKRHVL